MVWTLLFFNIENDFKNYIVIIIYILIDLGVNRPSFRPYSDILDHLANETFLYVQYFGKVCTKMLNFCKCQCKFTNLKAPES